jgi:hypothetical protein
MTKSKVTKIYEGKDGVLFIEERPGELGRITGLFVLPDKGSKKKK